MPYITARDGAPLYYEECGSGQPIVLVHGWACHHGFFQKQIPVLAQHFRVIALDLRGHGQSDRSDRTEYHMTLSTLGRDLEDVFQALKLEKTSVMAWSMGVQVVYDYIRQFGCGKLDRLVLVDMSPKTVCTADWAFGMRGDETYESSAMWASVCANDWKEAAAIFGPMMYENVTPANQEEFQWAMEQTADNVPHIMTNLVISMSAADYRDVLPGITVPVLLIHGHDSVLYGKDHGAQVHSMIPGSELKILPGGHILHMEHPEEFNAAALEFLTR